MQSSRNKIQTKVWLVKASRVLTGTWDHTPTLLWLKSNSSSPGLRWKHLKWKQIHKRLLLSCLRDVSNTIILLWGGLGGKVTLSPLRALTSLHCFDTFTLGFVFQCLLPSLCVPPMTRQAPLCSRIESSPGAGRLDTFFPGGWRWREITSAGLHFAVTGVLPSALTSSQLYTCWRSVPSSVSTHVCHSMLIPFLPFPLVPWETERTGPCDLVLQFSCVYIFTCLPSVLNCPCSNLLCCLFPLCYFRPIAPPLLCSHALPPHGLLLFAMQPLLTGVQWSHNCLQLVN